mgnify:CR=1 FL=1
MWMVRWELRSENSGNMQNDVALRLSVNPNNSLKILDSGTAVLVF